MFTADCFYTVLIYGLRLNALNILMLALIPLSGIRNDLVAICTRRSFLDLLSIAQLLISQLCNRCNSANSTGMFSLLLIYSQLAMTLRMQLCKFDKHPIQMNK